MKADVHPPRRLQPWFVMLVDDEPSVHEVSRLVLADLQFAGRDVVLLNAYSAAQARELLEQQPDVALVLLDVVMETDDAGLALVAYIRQTLHNTRVQIVLRTGQPGVAPEAEVVQRDEINGYFLKTDITAQRLHSIVISALRTYAYACAAGDVAYGVARAGQLGPQRQALARELAAARIEDIAVLQAQPELVLSTRQVSGVELQVHWRTSQGLLSSGRIGDVVGEGDTRQRMASWLLQQAMHWAARWSSAAGRPLLVSLPLIGQWLADGAIADAVADAVTDVVTHAARSGLPGTRLDLLVHEHALEQGCDTRAACGDALRALRAAGVSHTLTDFGAETISLPRLQAIGPNRLKIHRPFVRNVGADLERMALARSVIALAQTLQITVIADGIASDDDTQFFLWEGCDLGQGDALAPARDAADLERWLGGSEPTAH